MNYVEQSSEKANSSSASQESPRMKLKLHYPGHNSPTLVPILSQLSPVSAHQVLQNSK